MSKKLTVSAMKVQDAKNFGVRREIDVQGHAVLIDKVFRESKIRELLVELANNMEYIRNQGVSLDNVDISGYTSFLVIKHFTDIDVPEKVEEQLSVLNLMIDNGYFKPIINAFSIEEINKINTVMNGFLENIDEKLAIIREQGEKFEAIFKAKEDSEEV